MSRVVSSQIHFKSGVNKTSAKLGGFNDDFKKICSEMCIMATIAEYNEKGI